jgi:tellurite resistance protein
MMKTIVRILLTVLILVSANHAKGQGQIINEKNKPLTKMLLFKWNEEATEGQKSEMVALFTDLVKEVDGFDVFEITKLVYSYRFEASFVLKFNSEEAEKRYRAHPKHQQLASLGPKLVKDFQEIQY